MKCIHCTINYVPYIPIKFIKIKVLTCLFIVKNNTHNNI